jgi:hypothetical protein
MFACQLRLGGRPGRERLPGGQFTPAPGSRNQARKLVLIVKVKALQGAVVTTFDRCFCREQRMEKIGVPEPGIAAGGSPSRAGAAQIIWRA